MIGVWTIQYNARCGLGSTTALESVVWVRTVVLLAMVAVVCVVVCV